MGSQQSLQKCNFDDIQYIIKNKNGILINTLNKNEQNCLIQSTISCDIEENIINSLIKKDKSENIILYGMNCNDNSVIKKYEQLIQFGFTNVYIYSGGLFEWLCLQDIYGSDEFPTTKKELDLLKYKPKSIFYTKLLTYHESVD